MEMVLQIRDELSLCREQGQCSDWVDSGNFPDIVRPGNCCIFPVPGILQILFSFFWRIFVEIRYFPKKTLLFRLITPPDFQENFILIICLMLRFVICKNHNLNYYIPKKKRNLSGFPDIQKVRKTGIPVLGKFKRL